MFVSDSYTNLPHSLTLEANAEAGQPIYNVTIGYTVGGPAPKTVDLKNPSEYFAIENSKSYINRSACIWCTCSRACIVSP